MKIAVSTLICALSATILLAKSSVVVAAPLVNEQGDRHSATAEMPEKIKQRFTPVFGNEKEINEIISFISSNLVVELNTDQLKRLDGYMIATFIIDTTGNIARLDVKKSYNSWVDYAIIGALNSLPSWGRKAYDKNDNLVERQHDIVFTFGSYVKGSHAYGFQGDKVRSNTQGLIDAQRNAHYAKLQEERGIWNSYTDVNAKLEYNIKDGLRNEAGVLLRDDPFAYPKPPPLTTPTIKITQRD